MTIDALLSLGGNVGDRRAIMDEAISRLGAVPGIRVTARSAYYRTEPVGPVAQDWFVNLAVAVRISLDAAALAAACRTVEADLGRDRSVEVPSGPRPIDIDLIAVGDGSRMRSIGTDLDRRAFVLVPLAEIAGETWIDGKTVAQHAAGIDVRGVERLDWSLPGAC